MNDRGPDLSEDSVDALREAGPLLLRMYKENTQGIPEVMAGLSIAELRPTMQADRHNRIGTLIRETDKRLQAMGVQPQPYTIPGQYQEPEVN